MPLGSAKTRQFNLGTSELRVAPLTSAGRLLPAHSVGLVDSTPSTWRKRLPVWKGVSLAN